MVVAVTDDIEQQILTLLESSIEDTHIPEAIAAHADKRAGKLVTKTDAERLEAQLGIPVRICRQFGMTHITWGPLREEGSILLGHSDTNVHWPTSTELRLKDPAYFSARAERNMRRHHLLREHAASHDQRISPSTNSPSTITRAAAAIRKLREARAELDQLLNYDQPLHAVQYAVEKLVGKE